MVNRIKRAVLIAIIAEYLNFRQSYDTTSDRLTTWLATSSPGLKGRGIGIDAALGRSTDLRDVYRFLSLWIHEESLFERGIFKVLIETDHGKSVRVLLCGD